MITPHKGRKNGKTVFCFYQNDRVYKNKIYWIRKRYELSWLCFSYIVCRSIIGVNILCWASIAVAFTANIVLTSSYVAFVKNQASKLSKELIKLGFDLISGETLSGTIRGDSNV